MRCNTLESPNKKNRKRVGRGHGSGHGKTSGRGHKGLKARSGGSVKLGFEGGQTPIQRRLPKFGFNSMKARVREELRLNDLDMLEAGTTVTLAVLKEAKIVSMHTKYVKVFQSGEIKKALTVQIPVSKGAKVAIEAAGGKVENVNG